MSRFVKVSSLFLLDYPEKTCQKSHFSWWTCVPPFSTFRWANHFKFFLLARSRSLFWRRKLFWSRSATINLDPEPIPSGSCPKHAYLVSAFHNVSVAESLQKKLLESSRPVL